MKRFPRLVPAAVLLALGILTVAFDSRALDEEYRLSSLRVFNRVVLLVKEQYVEPQRIRPKEMFIAALEAVEKSVPEVLVEEPAKVGHAEEIAVVVGSERRSFNLDDVTSLWELSFKLRDVFRFLESRVSSEVDRRDVEYAATNGMLSKLDPHSVLLEPKFSQEMKLNTKGEFGGLGIVISIRDGALTVISPIDGTPADRAGVKAQDKIVKIGEESTVNMGLDEAVERLRGKPGTPVTIWILRKGWEEPQRFEIVRDVIKVDSVTSELLAAQPASEPKDPKSRDAQKSAPRIGYVKVKQFQGRTADDVYDAVAKMERAAGTKLQGLVLDLRNNPGGLLDQAVEVSNLFLPEGVLVVTQEGGTAGERREVKAEARKARLTLPVVVLVNGGSASASEIVAGAIKNRGRGVIVGDWTFGKGSVQQLYDFPDGSSLKLTIGQYLTPGDESIQNVGIVPDVHVLPIVADNKEDPNLFPDTHTREEDLDRHLNDARTKRREAVYSLAYLSETVSADEQERRDISSKFREDFEIIIARRILETAPHATRDGMLTGMKPVLDQMTIEQEKRVDDALLKLGVDWSRGPPGGKLSARVVDAVSVDAGGTLKLIVEVKNEGTTPIHRVRGITNATMGLFTDRELLFGKVMPQETKQWTVDMKVPKDVPSRRDLIRVELADDKAPLTTLNVPVTLTGLARPRFSYALFIDDTRGGNGDGMLQVGENVDLVVNVKNTGAGVSEEPMTFLKNLGGAEAFIETGRQKLDALKPGGSATARFAFKVQPPGSGQGDVSAVMRSGQPPGSRVDLRLQVFDGVTGDVLVEKLSFPIRNEAVEVKKKKGVVEASAATTVLAAADTHAPVLAHAPGGTRFDALAEVNGFVRVKIGSLLGYVAAAGVGPSKGKVALGADGEPKGLSFVYGRDPPRITFVGAESGSVVVDGDTFMVEARIEDDGPVGDAYVYVGDQKVRYELVKSKGPTHTTLKHPIKLKPGVNVVTVVAREDDEFAQREVLTVYSSIGDPLAKK